LFFTFPLFNPWVPPPSLPLAEMDMKLSRLSVSSMIVRVVHIHVLKVVC
jgi:hypothetical protein